MHLSRPRRCISDAFASAEAPAPPRQIPAGNVQHLFRNVAFPFPFRCICAPARHKKPSATPVFELKTRFCNVLQQRRSISRFSKNPTRRLLCRCRRTRPSSRTSAPRTAGPSAALWTFPAGAGRSRIKIRCGRGGARLAPIATLSPPPIRLLPASVMVVPAAAILLSGAADARRMAAAAATGLRIIGDASRGRAVAPRPPKVLIPTGTVPATDTGPRSGVRRRGGAIMKPGPSSSFDPFSSLTLFFVRLPGR
jgi:hypothetical protein